MSITSCFILFLLCLSVHASSARRLGAVDNKRLEKKVHFSIKNNTSVVVQVKSTSSKELGSIKEDSIEESPADDDTQKLEAAADANHKENEREKTSGAVRTNKSNVSVSWRVPHREHGEKHPGFNLDYSPPKTHPPSHN